VIATLLAIEPGDSVLDAGCGSGRHARVIAARGAAVVGLERSGESLRRATARVPSGASGVPDAPSYLRADLRALPLRPRSFDAAYSWYASLFMFDEEVNLACLAALAAVLRPGGRLLVHHANPLRLGRDPHERSRHVLPDGSVVEEESRFDAVRGVDRSARRLTRPDGRVLEGTAELRYYTATEWLALAGRAGLRLVDVTSTTDAGRPGRPPPGPEAPDLIVLLETPT
jgi:SAM-dependent methyltransferase